MRYASVGRNTPRVSEHNQLGECCVKGGGGAALGGSEEHNSRRGKIHSCYGRTSANLVTHIPLVNILAWDPEYSSRPDEEARMPRIDQDGRRAMNWQAAAAMRVRFNRPYCTNCFLERTQPRSRV